MRNAILRSRMKKVPFMLHAPAMDSLLEMVNSETPRAEVITPIVANESVVYQKIRDIAIISIDGGMYKKDIGGMCSSVASYDTMVRYIDKAENDSEIKTILFRVDTPGGAVAGADEVEAKIYNSKKKTITLYENLGASGGIYIFTASKELYATESTMLGSIGVVVSYVEKEEEGKRIEIVSKNASNKRCSLNGTCKEEIQAMIDTYEEMFYDRVIKNTGFTAEKIQTTFKNGGMIFAKEAHEKGFLQGVTTFDALLKSLNVNLKAELKMEANPTVSNDNSKKNTIGGESMFDRENLNATEERYNALVGNRETLKRTNDSLALKLETAEANLAAKTEEVLALETSASVKVSEAESKLESFKAETTTRLQEAIAIGVSAEVALAMVSADSAESASKLALAAKESNGRTMQDEQNNKASKEKQELEFALNLAKKQSI